MKTSINISPDLWSRVQLAARTWASSVGISGDRVTSLWVRKVLSEQVERVLGEEKAFQGEDVHDLEL